MNQPASAYFMEERHDPNESHTLSVLVQNEPGVLARVIGLFSGRGYNIESLTVSETESQKHLSRITIVTTGTPMVIEQIKHQLDRMVPVYRVVDMTLTGRSIERELAMVKLRGTGEQRVESNFAVIPWRDRYVMCPIMRAMARPLAGTWPLWYWPLAKFASDRMALRPTASKAIDWAPRWVVVAMGMAASIMSG